MPSATGSSGSSGAALAPRVAQIHDPLAIRHAGRELLSLALIDARNRVLALLARSPDEPALRRAALSAAWFQEWWIARHVQRNRGEACAPGALRLAGIEPRADGWMRGPDSQLPDVQALGPYLAETLEITLDLLSGTHDDAAALHNYRNALLHEDRLAEQMAERLRPSGPAAMVEREPVWLPARRWRLGSEAEPGAFTPCNERWAHEEPVPECEIDAQPVSWARYVEFTADRGYDRRELWSEAGWAWLQAGARRAPRFVEQLQGAVLVQGAGGALHRVPAAAPVMHVSRHEAEAWCRWAGRRLPAEPEWEQAACTATGRGFAWGSVFEWVAGSARAWPGAPAEPPGCLDRLPPPGTQGVLRGASWATASRWRHPKARRFVAPDDDAAFCGFRSCAL